MDNLTLAELRELETLFMGGRPLFPGQISYALRAVRELIACKESMEQEQQGMPWRALHKNDVVELLELEARHDRLRKAAEHLLSVQWGPADIVGPARDALRAALEDGKTKGPAAGAAGPSIS